MRFEDIYRQTDRAFLRSYVISMVDDFSIVDDIIQDIWLRILTRLDKFQNVSAMAIVIGQAKQTMIDNWRKRNTRKVIEYYDMLHTTELDYQPNFDTTESVQKSLQLIPYKYRELIELYYYKGLKYDEISEQLNKPMGTVKAEIWRAKKLLAKKSIIKELCE